MTDSVFYNAHHAPIGAFATFTLGFPGSKGGFGIELAKPADEPIYIGVEDVGGGSYSALPFFSYAPEGEPEKRAEADYDVEGLAEFSRPRKVRQFPPSAVRRNMGAGVDEWQAGDLTFRLYSPVRSVPDPDKADPDTLREAIAPAVLAELTVDNREGAKPRRAFFGFSGASRSSGMRLLDESGLVGVGQGACTAIATDDRDVWAGLAFQPEKILEPSDDDNLAFLVGNLGLLVGVVKPGERRTFRFAIGFFRDGQTTTGIETRYLYRRFFGCIEDVLKHALANFARTSSEAEAFDARLRERLSPERAWMTAHAIRSYFGSTQLLEREDGQPLWVVNEGEYRMMNTFDLTVDHAFFEIAMNPWTVRNVLDLFVERYSYEDDVQVPCQSEPKPGGLAFTHDMGVANAFSPRGKSGYEQSGLTGCFSYMSSEELLNWVLTAGLYLTHTGDSAWAASRRGVFLDCLRSLENRDHWEDALRNGVMGLDGARCRGGSEITTYDSLDASLGQARNNLYLAVKAWAAYLLLERALSGLGETSGACRARVQAERAAATILAARDGCGLLPAVIGEGVDARIIPAIEALVYPVAAGLHDEFPELRAALGYHLESVLRTGACKFADGGWKLSSTSRNSWLSKIYLCQFVAERILGRPIDAEADRAHVAWLLDRDNAYYAWSDQMVEGKAVGSRYYPRGVTSVLWMCSGNRPIAELRELLQSRPGRAD